MSLPILRSVQLRGGGRIDEVSGDLMSARDSLAHCVSRCLGMGKGIAKFFRDGFGQVNDLRAQQVDVGGVAVLHRPQENRYIYYLITKVHYSHKPTYQTLRASLQALTAHMAQHQVPSVSIPELGCGLDRLQWDQVYRMLQEEFAGKNITVTVYHYNGGTNQTSVPNLPRSSPSSQQQQQQRAEQAQAGGGAVAAAAVQQAQRAEQAQAGGGAVAATPAQPQQAQQPQEAAAASTQESVVENE